VCVCVLVYGYTEPVSQVQCKEHGNENFACKKKNAIDHRS